MARKGYPGITLRGEDAKDIDIIVRRENCATRAEAVRRLSNLYFKVHPEARAADGKEAAANGLYGILPRDLRVSGQALERALEGLESPGVPG